MPTAPPGFLLQGQSVTYEPTALPSKKTQKKQKSKTKQNTHTHTHSLYPGGTAIKLCQSCFCKMCDLCGVNVRDREGTESGTSLQGSRTANMQPDKIPACLSQDHGGWRLHQRGNRQSGGLGERPCRGLPCWRPSH